MTHELAHTAMSSLADEHHWLEEGVATKITAFFTSLNIPGPTFNAHFVSGLEFFGGVLLILGLGARPIALLLTGNMLVAYWTADSDALFAVFSDPGKFTQPTHTRFSSLHHGARIRRRSHLSGCGTDETPERQE
jgi:uncharacterized membrane protein YphA (DoxX/SURF4 family)